MSDDEELRALEQERCRAISAGDLATLDRLLADDLTHTHVTGVTEDKATYLAALGGRPRTTTRGEDLAVRLYGDVAVMTGTLRNAFPPQAPGEPEDVSEIHALQVWARAGGNAWRQVAFASSGAPRA
ncbi:MAG TPA: nuclear transport factor 2 family protein [Baekduia sp.]|nr:nuclear transport factor 2 family protein [Baekduia sp.]